MDEAARAGLTRQQFAYYCLMRLGIGKDLTRIAINSRYPRRLASRVDGLVGSAYCVGVVEEMATAGRA